MFFFSFIYSSSWFVFFCFDLNFNKSYTFFSFLICLSISSGVWPMVLSSIEQLFFKNHPNSDDNDLRRITKRIIIMMNEKEKRFE